MKRTYTVTLDDDTAKALEDLCARRGWQPESIIAFEFATSMQHLDDNDLEYERHMADWLPDFLETHPVAAMVPALSMKSFAALKIVADLAFRTPSQILEDYLINLVESWTDGGGWGEETVDLWLYQGVYEPHMIPSVKARIQELRDMSSRIDAPKYQAMWDELTAKLEAGELRANTDGIINKPLRNYLLALDPREISDTDLLRAVAHRLSERAAA